MGYARYTWVVVTIMVPFWIPPKRDHNLDNHFILHPCALNTAGSLSTDAQVSDVLWAPQKIKLTSYRKIGLPSVFARGPHICVSLIFHPNTHPNIQHHTTPQLESAHVNPRPCKPQTTKTSTILSNNNPKAPDDVDPSKPPQPQALTLHPKP